MFWNVNKDKNREMKNNYLDRGYVELFSTEKNILKKTESLSNNCEYITILFNEEEDEFKILYLKTVRGIQQYSEWTTKDAKTKLEKGHLILEVIGKLELNKSLNYESISNKRVKV